MFANRMKGTLTPSSEGVETKLCKPCTSFTTRLHSSCGMVWYRTLRVEKGKGVGRGWIGERRRGGGGEL